MNESNAEFLVSALVAASGSWFEMADAVHDFDHKQELVAKARRAVQLANECAYMLERAA